jgi:DNA polymerase-3 subunit alpha (Gram-positive type)
MTVKDIQEGLKTAVVEGEIWNLAINTLRDGRLAVSYYLTDYQDSIILKLFLNNENEHIFKVGDWVKVKGGVRYDPFIKEIALFVEQYEFPARNVRLDDYPDKRVELHAHTKMSSMDGLTEIEALIKRAAEWGHPAVAITDHGCVQSYPEAYSAARKNKIKIIYGVEGYLVEEDKKERSYHIVILARNEIGLRNLYRLVSLSYLKHFYRKPRIPRSELVKYREGLLLGTACEAGELYRAIIRGEEESRLEAIAGFYDYLEVQPLDNNRFLLKDKVESEERLIEFNRRIVAMGKKFNKPVVATGDVHFLDPQDEIFRSIIQAGQGYSDSEAQAPLYFRTTREMLDEFSYLGEEDARWVVIDGPARVAGWIDNIKPVPDGFYPPQIESAEAEITQLSWENAYARYGRPLPALVEERIKKELAAITKHGYAVLYLIAHKLVRRSNQDGYMVGSRGSVGSSLVAFLTGITEVNALEPHYVCPHCFTASFSPTGQ